MDAAAEEVAREPESGGEVLPAPAPAVEPIPSASLTERAAALSRAIAKWIPQGFDVVDRDNESGSAILRRRSKRLNHILHLLLSLFTLGLWLFVWLFLSIFRRREKRVFLSVDESGAVTEVVQGGMGRLAKVVLIGAGALVVFIVVIVVVVNTADLDEDSETPAGAATPAEAAAEEEIPGLNDTVRVGSLELTVLSHERYDATQANPFNDANYRVLVRVRKYRGEEYGFSILSQFTLIDRSGVGFDADFLCARCPDDLFADGGLTLYGDSAITRYVYFEIRNPGDIRELRYEPSSLSEPVIIKLH